MDLRRFSVMWDLFSRTTTKKKQDSEPTGEVNSFNAKAYVISEVMSHNKQDLESENLVNSPNAKAYVISEVMNDDKQDSESESLINSSDNLREDITYMIYGNCSSAKAYILTEVIINNEQEPELKSVVDSSDNLRAQIFSLIYGDWSDAKAYLISEVMMNDMQDSEPMNEKAVHSAAECERRDRTHLDYNKLEEAMLSLTLSDQKILNIQQIISLAIKKMQATRRKERLLSEMKKENQLLENKIRNLETRNEECCDIVLMNSNSPIRQT